MLGSTDMHQGLLQSAMHIMQGSGQVRETQLPLLESHSCRHIKTRARGVVNSVSGCVSVRLSICWHPWYPAPLTQTGPG